MLVDNQENVFFHTQNFTLLLGDSIRLCQELPANSIDMIFADPPYFLSSGGITCQSGQMVSVNKASWDISRQINEIHTFNQQWLEACYRILKPNGTIWVSGTYHNIYSIGFAMQELEYKLLNNITWYKRNAPPNLSCRYFTHSTETVLWARKSEKAKHYFNYELMKSSNNNKQMRDVWDIPTVPPREKKHGKFPTQKPLELLKRIILASTQENDIVLDPFNGSGTTGIAATILNRSYIGIDLEEEYLDLTVCRHMEINSNRED